MRIAIATDEVLADAHGAQRKLYGGHVFDLTDDDLRGHKLRDAASSSGVVAVERHRHQGTFFAILDPLPGAVRALQRLCADHEVFITTTAMEYPASCDQKVAWVMRHFAFFDPSRLVSCGDKSIIRAGMVIDDLARQFDGFGGRGLVYDALPNAAMDWPHRPTHWDHAQTTLQEMFA